MAELEDLDNHDQGDYIPGYVHWHHSYQYLCVLKNQLVVHDKKDNFHECCVELEVLFCGTDVIAPGQDALKDEGTAHRIEKSKMVWDAPAGKC